MTSARKNRAKNAEIAKFCSTNDNVRFPLFAKFRSKNRIGILLSRALIERSRWQSKSPAATFAVNSCATMCPLGDPTDALWNFENFRSVERARSSRALLRIAPNDPLVIDAIARQLAVPT
jgi:glutathione peroxidase-family protein